ncbi:TIGR03085 family metal-binding protein [Sphaerimonospora sp. CA-214678]|uniref:TIGR03085 family metal-binding protein n=1 Tax=Sphaerimonospora sp. CA-214678 TaxID=3240029 RepID=UPI003D8DBC3A
MKFSRQERAALCDLLDRLGPGAPTLCEGWATEDLAAHLVLREHRLDAAPGIAIPFLSGHTRAVQERLKTRHSYPELVDLVRQGPPAWSPYGLPGLDELVGTVELFIHHEDVRRAQAGWAPRDLPAGLQDVLWRRLRTMARPLLRRSPVGVVLRRTSGEKTAGRRASPVVIVSGEPAELALFAFGRGEQAMVDYSGDPSAVDRLRQTRFGL